MSSNWGGSSGSSSRSGVENSFDAEELLQIGTRCRELRKEKEMLRQSQSQSVELVRRLELSANSLSESRLEDKRRIQAMEKELSNCYQEIDYLSERVLYLEVKVTESGELEEEVNCLREELCTSRSEQLLLLQELESAETELHLSVEKLEESISSLTLESQCEIESMKLDVVALEQALFDAKKLQGESTQQRDELRDIVEELRFRSQEAQENAKCLEKQNKALKEELREEKLKAREEAEDLTQEMAEFRYKMTCLLEEECKRRARIEQASLQRIAKLEIQIKRENNKSSTCIIPLSSVKKLGTTGS